MQTIHLHPKFYRASKTVARLSDDAQQRWHRLNLYQQLRTEGCSEATALQAIGWSRASCYRWRRRLQQQGGVLPLMFTHYSRWKTGGSWMSKVFSEELKAQILEEYRNKRLLAFYNFPAMHWQSLRTTNPIESTFATIRHPTRRSKGCLTKTTMYKLGQCAEKKLRWLRGFRELGKVIEGVKFKNGIEVIYNETDQVAA